MCWAFSLKCVGPFLRKNQEKTLKMNGKVKRKTGESNSSNSGVRRRRPSRRLAGAMLKELLPVPTGCNPQSITSLSLSKFQNLEIFLSKVQTLTSLHSRIKAMANGYGTLQHAPSSRGMPVFISLALRYATPPGSPLPLLFPSFLSSFFFLL